MRSPQIQTAALAPNAVTAKSAATLGKPTCHSRDGGFPQAVNRGCAPSLLARNAYSIPNPLHQLKLRQGE